MARSTSKSLAGSAVSAARRAISRTTTKAQEAVETAAPPSATTTTGKSSAPKTGTAKTAATKKTTPKKTTAKKATTKAGTKAAAKSAPAKVAAGTTAKTAAAKAGTTKAAAKQSASKAGAAAKKTSAGTAGKTRAKKEPAAKESAAKRSAAKKSATAKPTKTTVAKQDGTPQQVSALVVGEGEAAWTKAEIKEVRSELTEHRERVVATLTAQEEELAGLMADAGDGAGQDQADMGATSFERDHELTVVNNEREKLAQIDRALARIEDGSYGICESCGNPIGKMRVMAFPRATLCLACKQREERR